jgi:hypothetical protein
MSSRAGNTTPERILELAELVLQRSRVDDLQWKETVNDAYFTQVGSYYFQVESEDGDGNHPFKVQIETPAPVGTDILASLSTSEDPFGDFPPRGDWKILIEELYKEARKRGSSVEKALNEMRDVLTSDRPAGDDDVPF